MKDMDEREKIAKELSKFQRIINTALMKLYEQINVILIESSLTKSNHQAESSSNRKKNPFPAGSSSKSQPPNKRRKVTFEIPNKRKKIGQFVHTDSEFTNSEFPNQVGASSSNAKIPNKRKKIGQFVHTVSEFTNSEFPNQVGASSSNAKIPNKRKKFGQFVHTDSVISIRELPNRENPNQKTRIPSNSNRIGQSVQPISERPKVVGNSKRIGQIVQANDETPYEVGSSSKSFIPNKRNKVGKSVLLTKDSEFRTESAAFSLEMLESLNYPSILGETRGYVKKTFCNSYNKVIIKEGADPFVVSRLFSYGLIHSIYPSQDLREMKTLIPVIQNQINLFKTIAKIPTPIKFYMKCFSIMPEWDPAKMKMVETIHVLVMGTTTSEYVVDEQKAFDLESKDLERVPLWRAQNIACVYREMKKMVQESKKGYFCTMQEGILFVNMASQWKHKHLMEGLVSSIEKGEIEGSRETLEKTCMLLKSDDSRHECAICQPLSS